MKILLFFLLFSLNTFAFENDLAQTRLGEVKGFSKNGVTAFLGIPYAKPPVENLRWKAPVPMEKWDKPMSCDKFGYSCPQPESSFTINTGSKQDEDCLTLNIWSGAKSKDDKLPVMVFIHGGGFYLGSSAQPVFNSSTFAKHGVILVSINYRLGPLGFLAHPELSNESEIKTSGNYGLLDQIAALKWVKQNISAFGGDVNNITLFGQSAGGVSVSLLMTSPLSKEIFNKAIIQSGWAPKRLRPLKSTGDAAFPSMEDIGNAFLKHLKVKSISEARKRGYGNLLNAWKETLYDFPAGTTGAESSSVNHIAIDGYAVIEAPYSAFSGGRAMNIPLMTGITENEGSLFSGFTGIRKLKDYEKYVRKTFGSKAEKILNIYPAENDKAIHKILSELLGDSLFVDGAVSLAKFSRKQQNNTWLYVFSKLSYRFETDGLGSFHGSELPYLFNSTTITGAGLTDKDSVFAKGVMGYWINFAKTGNPNGEGLPEWKPFDISSNNYLSLKEGFPQGEGLKQKQAEFFELFSK